MDQTNEGTLLAPGARIYYKVRGTGPVLLILQGGFGDADGSDGLAGYLADAYTVVTYDSRGLSRSKVDDASQTPGIRTHSDDVHRLLAALTAEPAFVLGISFGAIIALDLAARHPEQVRAVVALEAAAMELLPDAERAAHIRAHEEVDQLFRSGGLPAAMRKMVEISGVRLDDREPEVQVPRPDPKSAAARAANLSFFLTHDAPAALAYKFELAALKAAGARILPAAGITTGDVVPRHSAMALAERIGQPLVEFPGGHSGYALNPRAFALRLREVLGGPGGADRA
jgi:pimeloyl-ACP methyl ester carboxylesterase